MDTWLTIHMYLLLFLVSPMCPLLRSDQSWALTPRWWVYPSDTLQCPPIFDFLSFSLHHRFSNIHCAGVTFSDHHAKVHAITTNYALYLITPSAWYHVRDLPYDLWTMLLYFPFLVSSLLPDTFCRSPTNHRLLHHVIGTLPYVSPHMNLVLILLIVCI